MRLFVAIQFSPEVCGHLLQAQDVLRAHGTGRFTPPDNFHVTLAFLGQTKRVEDAVRAMKQITARPFPAVVQGIGQFGNLYWAGVQLTPPLRALQTQICYLFDQNGFDLEARDFIPHLTLCRKYRPEEDFSLMAAETALGQSSCRIGQVVLMESLSEAGRMVYREIFSRELTE